MDNEAYVLCVTCRSQFTPEQTKGKNGCPNCGSTSTPADTRDKATLTLTAHEWRILFIWADNWFRNTTDSPDKPNPIDALIREVKRQVPTLPALTVVEEMQDLANESGSTVGFYFGDTNEDLVIVPPERKH